ncbi:MAG: pyridoxal 5'-phosphate synthase glutaminase subunit PdxT [Thermodesulfobacteriota bacterium]
MKVGVLAVQGDFAAHRRALVAGGADAVLVRTPRELAAVGALVLPGGESTAMLHALARDGLEAPLAAYLASGRAVLGTCAGAILLARRVSNPPQRSFAALDVDVERNAYGTQLDSFAAWPDAGSRADVAAAPAVFIRAPRIVRVGPRVEVLATVRGDPVLVREGAVWAATFHPELAAASAVHDAWLAASRSAGRSPASSGPTSR